MLTAENGRVGMKVVAKTKVALTSVQGWKIHVGTVGEVKVMHKTFQMKNCPYYGGTYSGIVSVLWNDPVGPDDDYDDNDDDDYDDNDDDDVGYPAIHSDLTDIIIQCSKI